ncbi:hypothetical protein EYF80_025568 [Liparis tanakae]|uniref:Uncharacterized protein n=1 Tax=Liparis tanakae TaxID=230148 RepID=A0A4Z2HF72_9TELE|nr:hypothetical protein EYF80_025568 [Liparis tanakae]
MASPQQQQQQRRLKDNLEQQLKLGGLRFAATGWRRGDESGAPVGCPSVSGLIPAVLLKARNFDPGPDTNNCYPEPLRITSSQSTTRSACGGVVMLTGSHLNVGSANVGSANIARRPGRRRTKALGERSEAEPTDAPRVDAASPPREGRIASATTVTIFEPRREVSDDRTAAPPGLRGAQGSYIQHNSSSRGASSTRRRAMGAGWSARPFRDSWLISNEPRGETEAAAAAAAWSSRLEHMSYRFPENCIFLDSWRRDSQTAAASLGQPAIAALAQSWNSSHDLKGKERQRGQIQMGGKEVFMAGFGEETPSCFFQTITPP